MFDKLNFKFVMKMTLSFVIIFSLIAGYFIFNLFFIFNYWFLFLAILFPNDFSYEVSSDYSDSSISIFTDVIIPVIIFLLFAFFISLMASLIINVNRTEKVSGGKIYFLGTGLQNNPKGYDMKPFDLSIIKYIYIRHFFLFTILVFKTNDKIFWYQSFFFKRDIYINRHEIFFESKEEAYKFLKQNHLEPYLRTDLKY